MGREAKKSNQPRCDTVAELPPAAVPSGSAGSLDAVRAAPGAGRSRTDTQHSTPSDARAGTKGKERRADVMEE